MTIWIAEAYSVTRGRTALPLCLSALVLVACAGRLLNAQSIGSSSPPQAATAVERLMIEQVDQLIAAEQYDEALSNLQRLYDQGAGDLVESGSVHGFKTLQVQHFVPLRQWCQTRTLEVLGRQPSVRQSYLQQLDGLAEVALRTLQATKDPIEAKRVAHRFLLSQYGDELTYLLADLYLERGWSLAALAELERIAPELRYRDSEHDYAWPVLWARTTDAELRERMQVIWRKEIGATTGPIENDRLKQAMVRMLDAAALQPVAIDKEAVHDWVRSMAENFPQEQKTELVARSNDVSAWRRVRTSQWNTFASDDARSGLGSGRYDLSTWPVWQQQLEGYGTSSDRTNASKPRAGETNHGALPYHPVVANGRLYINEMNRIRGFDMESGKAWPDVSPALPLFDSHISSAAYVPLGYPLVGVPRGTLAVADDCLYARMGSPVTGWANRESASDGGSLSYLVGLDLRKQGSMLRGFPLRLMEPEFSQAEFEGCPIIWGEMLLATIVERDNVGVRRSVVAFDRFDGELAWRSHVLAGGTVEGSERANLITHQLLTLAGGRLYYNTNLGSIACLDPLTGETEWLVQYKRFDKQKQTYPTPDRFRYRDLTPCVVSGGLVYCMPRDCPELFALDATSGQLVWSTDDLQVADAVHILGVQGNSLIVSGDRITWLHRRTGQILGRFPGLTTPGSVNALPSPRGLGRGAIADNAVYWPTAGEVFVFDSDMSSSANVDAPPIKRRFPIGNRGSAGGNLCIASGHLIFCGPRRLIVFDRLRDADDDVSLLSTP